MKNGIRTSLVSVSLFVLAACGELDSSFNPFFSGGLEPATVQVTIHHPNETEPALSPKGFMDFRGSLASKSVSVSPDSCTLTCTSSTGGSLCSTTFHFFSTVTVDISIDPQSAVTFAVTCTDSTLRNNSVTYGYEGSTSATVGSGRTTVALTPKGRNVLSDSNSAGLTTLSMAQVTGDATQVQLDFTGLLTAAQKAAAACTIEFNTTKSSETTSAIDSSTATCLTAGSSSNPYVLVTGGIAAPVCEYYTAAGVLTFRGSGSWSTDSGGSNTRAICAWGGQLSVSVLDADEKGYLSASCRIASSGSCDTVPDSGFLVYDTSTNTSPTTSLEADGGLCTTDADCLSGWCVSDNGEFCTNPGTATLSGSDTVIGGSTNTSGSTNGTAADSRFNTPSDLALSADGDDLYVADRGNHIISRMNLTVSGSEFKTLCCGQAGSNGNMTGDCSSSAQLDTPRGIVINSTDTALYVLDTVNNIVRTITLSNGACGTMSTLAGSGVAGSADGTGTAATFNGSQGIEIDSTGTNLYVLDTGAHILRKIVISTGVVTTIAGTGSSGSTNGDGTAASFNGPRALALDSTDTNLYIADAGNSVIRVMNLATTTVTTLTTTGDTLTTISAIEVDPTDALLYVASDTAVDRIYSVPIAGGAATRLVSSSLNSPRGLMVSKRGVKLWFADSSEHTVDRID